MAPIRKKIDQKNNPILIDMHFPFYLRIISDSVILVLIFLDRQKGRYSIFSRSFEFVARLNLNAKIFNTIMLLSYNTINIKITLKQVK